MREGTVWRRLIGIPLIFFCVSAATAEGVLLWDESVDGDLSDDMNNPTLIAIDQPGEYVLRATTGPIVLVRRDQPVELAGLRLEALQRLDENSDTRLQRSEAAGNYAVYFETFDLNNDDELAFDEISQFEFEGDVHDLFDFVQAVGINLVAIRISSFDGGGAQNDASVVVVMDHTSGRPREARGVEITSKSESELGRYQSANPSVIAGPARAGEEIYEQFGIWKAYRRNDESNHFRIGEMQAKSTTELLFIFE
jgi:hypothetical protein